MTTADLLHYAAAAFGVVLSSCGSSLGQGLAGNAALEAFSRQPMAHAQMFRSLIIGLALIESGSILALVVGFMTLFTGYSHYGWGPALAELGIALAIGIAAGAVGIASSYPVSAAVEAISRQPFFAPKITTLMLISQSIIEAPVIFAFIVVLFIKGRMHEAMSLAEGAKLACCGLLMGFAAVGPSWGQALFARATCKAVGVNRNAYQRIFSFSLMCQAIVETPVIFSLIIVAMLIYKPLAVDPLTGIGVVLAGVLPMMFGSLGTGIASGFVASRSVEQIAQDPSNYGALLRYTLLAQAFIESSLIYALIVSFLLIFR